MLTTKLSLIMDHRPCADGFKQLKNYLGDDYPEDKPIDLLTILESNGVQDCLWSLRCADATEEEIKKISVKLAIEFARRVLPIFEKKHPDNKLPRQAIEAAENWLKNPTEENRRLAEDAAATADAYAYATAAADAYAYAAYGASDVKERAFQKQIIIKHLK
jgi:hypothetical protein